MTTACASNKAQESEEKKISANISFCKEPRPQMCTMQYDPVCGLVAGNSVKTYGNACSACGDSQVSQYVKGECPTDALERFLDGTIGDAPIKKQIN
ncbi:hypothetical protein [Litorilituus lipolyticus]|nr:hypothetical protein [Litorilituus lipolyticus]